MNDIISTFKDAFCEVKTLNNQLLLLGRLYNIIMDENGVSLDVAANNGEKLLRMEFGARVKISLRQDNRFLVLAGTIYAANEKFWRINHIEMVQETERRRFFRVCTAAGAQVEIINQPETELSCFDAQLVDISLSGLKFKSNGLFSDGDKIKIHHLTLAAEFPPFTFNCDILDHYTTIENGIVYRCTLSDLSMRSSDLLCKAIFAMERQQIKHKKISY